MRNAGQGNRPRHQRGIAASPPQRRLLQLGGHTGDKTGQRQPRAGVMAHMANIEELASGRATTEKPTAGLPLTNGVIHDAMTCLRRLANS